MIISVRDIQIRINSLEVLQKVGKPPLLVDGVNGPTTRLAIEITKQELKVNDIKDIFDPSGITRVHWHWTGGNHKISYHDKKYYNDLFDYEGNHYDGISPAHHQAHYMPGRVGVSHTLNANTGAIGMAVAGMFNAQTFGDRVDVGKYPITWDSIDAMLERTVEYCKYFDIKISPWTTLTHAEVQKNIGIRQRNKWDIQILPDKLDRLYSPRDIGDKLRKRMVDKFL